MSTPKIQMRNNVTPLSGEPVDRRLGALLVAAGKLAPDELEHVLRAQKEERKRFGDLAVKLGFVSERDVLQMLARQFEYSYLEPGQNDVSSELVAAYEPFSHRVETLRALRSQLKLRWFDAGGRALAILSPQPGDGRSYLAANLAIVFSQLGERTLLIDGDMRAPRQHRLFNLPDGAGLSTVLVGRDDASVVQRIPRLANLSVLAAGPTPPNPAELLDRPALPRLLDQLKQDYDVILVDTPAAQAHADAQTIAMRCAGALLVVRRNMTRIGSVKALAASMQRTQIVGTVLNEF